VDTEGPSGRRSSIDVELKIFLFQPNSKTPQGLSGPRFFFMGEEALPTSLSGFKYDQKKKEEKHKVKHHRFK
jgi:hypothetical protein